MSGSTYTRFADGSWDPAEPTDIQRLRTEHAKAKADLAKAMAIIREVFIDDHSDTPESIRRYANGGPFEHAPPRRSDGAEYIDKKVTLGSWLDAADLVERYPAPPDGTADERHALTTDVAIGFLTSDAYAAWIEEVGGRQLQLEDLLPPEARAENDGRRQRGRFLISATFIPTCSATPRTSPSPAP